ncbi:MAG: hypothetical protein HDQ93_05415 [Desulfovibrio sp.]|nr:hypothetical protein [Desulfovibrio sp.]
MTVYLLKIYHSATNFIKKLLTPQKKNCHLCGMCHGLCSWMKDKKTLSAREDR